MPSGPTVLREVFRGSRPTRRAPPRVGSELACRDEESWQHLRFPREDEVSAEIETTTGDPVVTATRPWMSHRKVEKDGFLSYYCGFILVVGSEEVMSLNENG